MQLPRVVIAAVFFVIGALIAVPALIRTASSPTSASESPPTSAPPATGLNTTHTITGTPSPTRTRTPSPTRTTRTPTPTPTPTTTRPPAPPVTPTRTTPPPPPLTVTIASVVCPERSVDVTVSNRSNAPQDYTIETDDGAAPRAGSIPAGGTRMTSVTLREDRRTRITVTWRNEPVERETHTANCRRTATADPDPDPTTAPPDRLPNTGANDGVLIARTATGVAAMVTGVIIFWYGGIWPRRRDAAVFGRKSR
jgi:hypothetical protein